MNILAFDTSSDSGSIALLRTDGLGEGGVNNTPRLIAQWTVADVGLHARWLLKSIDSFLKSDSVNTSITDIDYLAVTAGPGSFTGLRIGISTVKGLAWSLGVPVVTVSTMEAMAMNIDDTADAPRFGICPVLDARKKEVYTALFTLTMNSDGCGEYKRELADIAIAPQELVEVINKKPEVPTVFLGTGLNRYEDFLSQHTHSGAFIADAGLWPLRAASIARLALRSLNAGVKGTTAIELTPTYLRKSEAELKAKKNKG